MDLNRRQLGRALAGGALLSRLAPFAEARDEGKNIGYAIIGLGRISMQHFMPGVKTSSKCRITGLVSGHRDKAEKIAAQYNVPTSSIYDYKNMDEMAGNKEIDAVYVALPNSMHAEYTIRSAKAGKHVLCEKPMATTVKDSQAMIDACRKANKKLMIAYRCQLEPTNLAAIKMIRDGKLGKVQSISSANGFNIRPGEWRLNKELAGGGPLMDVGIYSLNACRYLTGEEPAALEGYSSVIDHDGRFNEVEENLSWTMKFPSGIVTSCTTTYGANMPGSYTVYGSNGYVHLEPAFAYEGIHLTAHIHGQPPIEQLENEKDPAQFLREGEYFADCVNSDKEPKPNGEEGLRDMKLMAEIYASAKRRT
ncbi:MAG: Gfo/Idh/MocA family oxidoreductase [Bryobacteraceae bacterium]